MKPVFVFLAVLLLVGCGGQQAADDYQPSIDDWHAGRVERLRAEDGWLSLVGLHPLASGANTVGTAEDRDVRINAYAPARIGTFQLTDGGLRFEPVADAKVSTDGGAVTEAVTVVTDAAGTPTVFRVGTVSFHVIVRAGEHFLRVKDSASPVRRDFEGIERYPVNQRWRVTARLETVGMPPTVPISNILGQVTQEPSPGVLVFELDGRRHRLIPVGEAGKSLFLVFGDATNGKGTYGGGRFLSTEPPGPEGTVILDFNKATNPPCAFTPYATCPMPPPENVLPVPVTAGEKAWGDHY